MNSKLIFADRMSRAGTETAFEVVAMAKEMEKKGINIIHFEIGEPDFDTPDHIKNEAVKALKEGFTHYTPAPGIQELRESIAKHLEEKFGSDINPNDEVIVMPGAKPGLFTGILATINPGDEVIMQNPAFPIYESVVKLVNGKPIPIPLREENDFRLNPEDVRREISDKTKMLILNSPHNPCGSSLLKKEVKELAEIAKENDLWIMSDEIYSDIIYDKEHNSMLSELGMKDRLIFIHGFSKSYAMTGWRLGYAVGNPEIISRMTKLQINIHSCASAFIQKAAIKALEGPQDCITEMVGEYKKRRDAIVKGLNGIKGFDCKIPTGAFYVFPNIKKLGMKSKDLMQYLLNEAHISALHGDAFGIYGSGYMRFSYATSLENIIEGVERVKEAVEEI
jgi:aspartate aminotransferase